MTDRAEFERIFYNALLTASLERREKPRGLVYHYTSPDGLLGILKSRKIWATDFRHLNDSREVLAGVEASIPIIAEEVNLGLKRLKGDLTDELRPAMDAIGEGAFGGVERWLSDNSIFVASCSEPGDSLPQWREYGGRCAGFSIGIDPRAVMVPSTLESFDLFKCVYHADNLSGILRTRARAIFDALETALAYILRQQEPEEKLLQKNISLIGWTAIALHRLQAEAAICYKDSGFESEQEWRFVGGFPLGFALGEQEFRSSAYGITPYIELDLPTGSIKEIIVGPKFCSNGQVLDATRRGVQELLRRSNWDDVEIVPSSLSVR